MAFAYANDWRLDLPPWLFVGGIGSAMIIGTVAGAYPALRASRFPPMEALRGG
jgi:putative ABC transport system permease protein